LPKYWTAFIPLIPYMHLSL